LSAPADATAARLLRLRLAEFPEREDAWADRIAAQANFPVYFIDDETAIRVNGDKTDIVSEGRWRFHP
jgi:dipeptidase E